MLKLNAKSEADSLLYSLSHFECDGHTVHMLRHLLPPLTSTVKSSLFVHADCSPLSSAGRSNQCRTNRSHYINNGWTFSWQTLYICFFFLLLFKNSCLHFPPTTPLHTRIRGWCISAFGGQKVSMSNFESTVYIPSITLIINEKEKK